MSRLSGIWNNLLSKVRVSPKKAGGENDQCQRRKGKREGFYDLLRKMKQFFASVHNCGEPLGSFGFAITSDERFGSR